MKILIEKSEDGLKVLHVGTNSQIDHLKRLNEKFKVNEIIYEEEINGCYATFMEFYNETN